MRLKQRIPFLRWSVWRLATRVGNINTTGQVGDGREAAAVEYVRKHARAGDIDDEKGALLDATVRRADPKLALGGSRCSSGNCERQIAREGS